jgi:hypothetical protein
VKGSTILKNYKKQSKYYSIKDYDERVGGDFHFLIEPLNGCNDEKFFYVKHLPNGNEDGDHKGYYEVTGEGYIISNPSDHTRQVKELKEELKDSPIWYYHTNNAGDVIKKECVIT